MGEFAGGAAADTSPPLTGETPPQPVPSPRGVSPESIGVATTGRVPEPVAAPEEEAPSYFCENCKGKVVQGDPECSTCEETLNWSGLA